MQIFHSIGSCNIKLHNENHLLNLSLGTVIINYRESGFKINLKTFWYGLYIIINSSL